LSLYKRHRVTESVLNECLRLYNKPKAEVHPGHKLTGPKEEEELPTQAAYHSRKVKISNYLLINFRKNMHISCLEILKIAAV
jgi:hypothetical protein